MHRLSTLWFTAYLSSINVFSFIFLVNIESDFGPVCCSLQAVILLVVVAEVVRQLASHNTFLDKTLHALRMRRSILFDVDDGSLHRNLSHVHPGRHVGQCLFVRVISFSSVHLDSLVGKLLEVEESCLGAGSERAHGVNSPALTINIQPGEHFLVVGQGNLLPIDLSVLLLTEINLQFTRIFLVAFDNLRKAYSVGYSVVC